MTVSVSTIGLSLRFAPPWDYACRCMIEDIDKAAAAEHGGINKASVRNNKDGSQTARVDIGSGLSIDTPASGYIFDVREAFEVQDMSRIKDVVARKAVLTSIAKFARKNDGVRFNCIPGKTESLIAPVVGDAAVVTSYIEKQSANYAKSAKFAAGDIKVGSLSQEVLDGLGMESGQVMLGKGSGTVGLEHMLKNHKEDILNGTLTETLKDTLFSGKVKTTLTFAGKKQLMVIGNDATGALTTLVKRDGEWHIVSSFHAGKEKIKKIGSVNR